MDGGFAGPDTLHSFDRLTAEMDAIETLTGPYRGPAVAPEQPSGSGGAGFKQDTLRNIASFIGMNRQAGRGDDRIVYSLMAWAETPLPNFRKLP